MLFGLHHQGKEKMSCTWCLGTLFCPFWCRRHQWFHWMGGLQAKSMTSQRNRAVTRWRMCYYGNVMTTTRRRMCYYSKVILHLQQYSHRLNLLCNFFSNHNVSVTQILQVIGWSTGSYSTWSPGSARTYNLTLCRGKATVRSVYCWAT